MLCEHNLKNNGPPVLHIRIYWQTERNWKVGPNEREGGRRMQEENKCETNVWKIWKKSNMKSDRKTLLSGKPKWEEGRKAAPQPHPVHLCEVGQRESASSRVEKVNSVRSCPLSIKILCHNLQWNFGYLFGHFFALKLLHVWLWMQPENGWKQIWNKYERNPTEKYSWVKIPNWWRNFPKLVVDRKAALQPHPVHLCEVGQWESARSRVEKANSVRSCPLSMKIFATICHGRKIPRSQGIRSPNSQRSELGNLTSRTATKNRSEGAKSKISSRTTNGPLTKSGVFLAKNGFSRQNLAPYMFQETYRSWWQPCFAWCI